MRQPHSQPALTKYATRRIIPTTHTVEMPKNRKKNKDPLQKWKPDKNLPNQIFDPIIGGGVESLSVGGKPSKIFGPDLLGSWQWINDDTIAWSLTKNSRKAARKIGAESSGFIDVDFTTAISDGVEPHPFWATLYKDAAKTIRVTDGSFEDLRADYSAKEFLETKTNGGIYSLVYKWAGYSSPWFALLNNQNIMVADGVFY